MGPQNRSNLAKEQEGETKRKEGLGIHGHRDGGGGENADQKKKKRWILISGNLNCT
jgi:hypothetical protein